MQAAVEGAGEAEFVGCFDGRFAVGQQGVGVFAPFGDCDLGALVAERGEELGEFCVQFGQQRRVLRVAQLLRNTDLAGAEPTGDRSLSER